MEKFTYEERQGLIAELTSLEEQIRNVVSQLEDGSDTVYYESHELAMVLQCSNMEFTVGTDPSDGKRKFMSYKIGELTL